MIQKKVVWHKPARSTKFMLLLFLVSWPVWFLLIWSKTIVTTVWALELVAFICVAATVRLAVPVGWKKSFIIWLNPWESKIKCILHFDWLPKQLRWHILPPLRIYSCIVPPRKSFLFGHTINPLLTMLVWSRWLYSGLVLFAFLLT